MAEQVNQRIESMINELEQMRRTNLYTSEEIREISRRRKEFEYKIQRQTKQKEDFIHYIAYDITLLEDVSARRKQINLNEKKGEIEYAIAKRLNRIFKQFIYRFQDDIEVYFQYIKFCRSVGFDQSISGIIGQMLQIYGDKPKMWQMATKWELEEIGNEENVRNFLLKGIHRHPDSDILYIDLFNLELTLAQKAEDDVIKEKQLKRADVIWKNGTKNIKRIHFLFQLCDISLKYSIAADITADIKTEIWSRNTEKEVWSYIAGKELVDCHWEEIEELATENSVIPEPLNNFVSVYEEAISKYLDNELCTKYVHELLKLTKSVCNENQKIKVVKSALKFGHEKGVLADDLYGFWLTILKEENYHTSEELKEIMEEGIQKAPKSKCLWEELLKLSISDGSKSQQILEKASKILAKEDLVYLWNIYLENIDSKAAVKDLHDKIRNCDSAVLLEVKPKVLRKFYEINGIKTARNMYDEFIRTPPIQLEVHNVMIEIEKSQEPTNAKCLRKCYEMAVQYFGRENTDVWLEYIDFEVSQGSAKNVPLVYQRAISTLKKEIVDDFIKKYSLTKLGK